MTQFTDSPMEWMMKQKPRQRCEVNPLVQTGPSQCCGCNYFKGSQCIGVCYRNLITSSKERRAET